jgi:hypothetical protein
MPNIYELGAEHRQLVQILSDFDGDITEEIKEEYISTLLGSMKESTLTIGRKADGYLHVADTFDSDADACDAEIARLKVLSARRRASAEQLRNRLRDFLDANFKDANGKVRLDTPLHSLTVVDQGGQRALEIDEVDIATVPEPMITVIPEYTVPETTVLNKDAVRDYCKAVENGVKINDEPLPALEWARLKPRARKLKIQ